LIPVLLIAILAPTSAFAQDAADPALELYYAANASYNRKLYPIAVGQYQDFLKKHGNHEKASQARYGLALSYYALKQADKALPELQRPLEAKNLDKSIDRERVVLMHAQWLITTGKSDEALKRLMDAAKNLPDKGQRAGAAAAVIDLYYAKSQWEQAVEWAGVLEKAGPTTGQAIRAGYQQGMALYQLKRVPEALKTLNKARDNAAKATSMAWTARLEQLLGTGYIASDGLAKAEAPLQSAFDALEGAAAADARCRVAAVWGRRALDRGLRAAAGRWPHAWVRWSGVGRGRAESRCPRAVSGRVRSGG